MRTIFKSVFDSVLDVDSTTKRVKVVLSKMGNKDLDGDIITPGAFNRTIKARGPQGTNDIYHLIDHRASFTSTLGKFSELYVSGDQLIGVSEKKDTTLWKDVMWPLYVDGTVNQHSIGFSIPDHGTEQKGDVRMIKEVNLYEGSAVLWGANPQTPTLEVSKALMGVNATIDERIDALIDGLRRKDFDEEAKNICKLELIILKSLLDPITPEGSSTSNDSKELHENEERELKLILFKHF